MYNILTFKFLSHSITKGAILIEIKFHVQPWYTSKLNDQVTHTHDGNLNIVLKSSIEHKLFLSNLQNTPQT